MKFLHTALVLLVMLFVSCGNPSSESNNSDASSTAANLAKQSSPEYRSAYIAAKTEAERRDVFLRAIDDGVIAIGKSIAVIDTIAEPQFTSYLPKAPERSKFNYVLFADQEKPIPKQPADHLTPANSYVGSYFDFQYDSNGYILKYYFSNLHKGGSRRTDLNSRVSNEELKLLYQTAQSMEERRNVCFRAIDEGIIQTFGPVNVSTVDAVFGTEFSQESQTRSRKESERWVYINCDANASSGTTPQGWYLAIELVGQGNVSQYYLTNVPK